MSESLAGFGRQGQREQTPEKENTCMTHKLIEASYHRNGVCGEGFHVAIVESEIEPGDIRKMLCVTFSNEMEAVRTAVFDLALLEKGNIRFTENSWRGDHWHGFMRDIAIPTHEKAVDDRFNAMIAEQKDSRK